MQNSPKRQKTLIRGKEKIKSQASNQNKRAQNISNQRKKALKNYFL
jgi:hypothetical protein